MTQIEYREWRQWPEDAIRAYASAIATRHRLNDRDAEWTAYAMVRRADPWGCWYRPKPLPFRYPTKLDAQYEAMFRDDGFDDKEIFEWNQQRNCPLVVKPVTADELAEKLKDLETVTVTEGRGLNKITFEKRKRESKIEGWMRKHLRSSRNAYARNPFLTQKHDIETFIEDARWVLNCLPLGSSRWLLPSEPQGYGDPLWFLAEIERAYRNVRRQIEIGNAGAAALHAYRLGTLKRQLTLDIVKGGVFEKYDDLRDRHANRRGVRSVADETLANAYTQARPNQKNMTATLRAVAEAYAISEGTVRNALDRTGTPRG